ncbi:MAG: hypothetical protein H6922_05640 [Pseudomonadaceae bacterium]|nr:hypothetical protein [Pseudomonadaceae bacterium]
MHNKVKTFSRRRAATGVAVVAVLVASVASAAPVPGYIPPTTQSYAPEYVDDTRGVYVPSHAQQRMKSESELAAWQLQAEMGRPFYAQNKPQGQYYEQALNTVSTGVADTQEELNRIAQDPGLLSGGTPSSDAQLYAYDAPVNQYAQNYSDSYGYGDIAPAAGPSKGSNLQNYPSLATSGQPGVVPQNGMPDGGREIAVSGARSTGPVDLANGIVRLKEERITVRRALQRMMDQVGGSNWVVVWDLEEQNVGLPDMEISIYAEEPFMNVLNSLLARLQTRSGNPLRVIRYDRTQRLVITDRVGGAPRESAGMGIGGSNPKGYDVAVTETVLKEHIVSLHYDEVPLVDALENIINQAGKGQWRLRMYAGTDQVLKPAHIEEPFGVAVERILRVFNLRYEIFPGGKLIVVTAQDNFGFRGVQ